jgi:hypothetical protein
MAQPFLTKNHVKSHLQKYRDALKKGKVFRIDEANDQRRQSYSPTESFDSEMTENDSQEVDDDNTLLDDSGEGLFLFDDFEPQAQPQPPPHRRHLNKQVPPPQQLEEPSDVFLQILKSVSEQDRAILLQLVDTMKQMSNSEQCSSMLRGYNMGIYVGVKFAHLLVQSSESQRLDSPPF